MMDRERAIARDHHHPLQHGLAVEGAWLVLRSGATTLRLELGAKAEAWAKKIHSPPSLLDKLGIGAGARVAVVGTFEDSFVAQLEACGSAKGRTDRSDVVLLRADAAGALAKLASLRKKIADDAAVWVVFPKGKTEPREADVLGAGRAAGFKDVKVARFSETHTALKFVVPKEARRQ